MEKTFCQRYIESFERAGRARIEMMELLEKQDKVLRKTVAKMREGDGRGFISEPQGGTLCTELRGNDTVIPDEAWAIHGEDPEVEVTEEGIFDCDAERDPRDPENHHIELENLAEDDFSPDRYDDTEEEREANRDPEWDPRAVAQAGVKLMNDEKLSPTSAMCQVVGAYMGRLEYRMDGVIYYYLDARRNNVLVEAALEIEDAAIEFAIKMAKHFPEISKQARKRLIDEALREQQFQRRIDGPAYRLGRALFNSHWKIMLRYGA